MTPRIGRQAFNVPVPRVAGPGAEYDAVSQGLQIVKSTSNSIQQEAFRKKQEELDLKSRADDATALLDASISYEEQILALSEELDQEIPDNGDGYAKTFKEREGKIRQQILGGLPTYVSEQARQKAQLNFTELGARGAMNAAALQDQRVKDFSIATYEKSLRVAATKLAENPDDAKAILQGQTQSLASIQSRLDPNEREGLARSTGLTAARSLVEGFSRQGRYGEARSVISQFGQDLDAGQAEQLQGIIERAERQNEAEKLDGYRLDVLEGRLGRQQINELHRGGDIDDGEKIVLSSLAERQEQEARSKRDAELVSQSAQRALQLELDILDGRATRADLDLSLKRGEIDQKSHVRLAKQAATASQKQEKYSDFLSARASGIPINPYDSEAKGFMDQVFDNAGGASLMADPESAGLVLNEMGQAGVFAPKAISTLQGMRLNGDSEQQLAALQVMSDMHARYPRVFDAAINDKDLQEVIAYKEMSEAGVDSNRITEQLHLEREARTQRKNSPNNVVLEEARKLSAEKSIGHVRGLLPGITGGKLAGDERAENHMLLDYRSLFENEYVLNGGNEKLAKEYAKSKLAQTWARSQVNGGKIMAYAPELYLPNIDPEDMRSMVLNDARELSGPAFDEGSQMNSVELVADPMTVREARNGDMPSYSVMVRRKGGTVDILPRRFSFDVEALNEMQAKRKSKKVEDARAKKEAQMGTGVQLDELTAGYR